MVFQTNNLLKKSCVLNTKHLIWVRKNYCTTNTLVDSFPSYCAELYITSSQTWRITRNYNEYFNARDIELTTQQKYLCIKTIVFMSWCRVVSYYRVLNCLQSPITYSNRINESIAFSLCNYVYSNIKLYDFVRCIIQRSELHLFRAQNYDLLFCS